MILVISDTHGKINNVCKILSQNKNIKSIIHLGDLVQDAEDIKYMYDIPVYCVAGNNDYYSKEEREKVIEIENKKFFITHGHNYDVKMGLNRLVEKAKLLGVDCVLFGHTHNSYSDYISNILVLNPGSISLPKGSGNPTYSIIEIQDNKLFSNIYKC